MQPHVAWILAICYTLPTFMVMDLVISPGLKVQILVFVTGSFMVAITKFLPTSMQCPSALQTIGYDMTTMW